MSSPSLWYPTDVLTNSWSLEMHPHSSFDVDSRVLRLPTQSLMDWESTDIILEPEHCSLRSLRLPLLPLRKAQALSSTRLWVATQLAWRKHWPRFFLAPVGLCGWAKFVIPSGASMAPLWMVFKTVLFSCAAIFYTTECFFCVQMSSYGVG